MNGIVIADPRGGLVGAHVWDGSDWQKLSGDADGLDALLYGYDGATNRRIATDASGNIQAAVLTYPNKTISGNVPDGWAVTALAAGTDTNATASLHTEDIYTIVGGYMLTLQAASALNVQRVCRVVIVCRIQSTDYVLFDGDTPGANEWAVLRGPLRFGSGVIRIYWVGTVAGDDVSWGMIGHLTVTS